ncbi:MAG: NADH-quinone oxidoreductase subunit J [Candidatus Aminicenantaceae bacterium]
MELFLFTLLSILCIGAVLGMLIVKNQAYSAIFLVLAFACTAGLFALLDAPFIAVVQIIIYAGAILVLFIFVIMMVDIKEGLTPEKKKWTLALACILAVVLLIELLVALKSALSPMATSVSGQAGNASEIGHLLFTKYLYPFEITSVLIIAAMVGAIVLVKKKDSE